ncbi:MAG TPA: UrcA family protein [Caulobacteraceae bacterium]|nr:UrcA family protein [Caulobacteraceae bacterium]
MLRSQLIVALGISTAFAVCGAASAAGFAAIEPTSVVVRTDNVNLHTSAGGRLMALRIRNAAAAACGGEVEPVAIRVSDGFIRCREAAVDRAVRDLNAPMVADALDRSPQMLSRGD